MSDKTSIACIARDGSKVLIAHRQNVGQMANRWEFPGGKIEPGEEPEDALKREIREELATEIKVQDLLTRVEYDYPHFHLTMHCYLCSIESGQLSLLEHEDARWLTTNELNTVLWLPADKIIVEQLIVTNVK